jgi:hypothetical protein
MLAALLLGTSSSARASPLRRLAASTTSFATDGVRYAAWQDEPTSPVVILDTYTATRRVVQVPGCVLQNETRARDGWFSLSCFKEARDGCFVAGGAYLLRCGERLINEEATTAETETASQSRQQVSRLLDARTATVLPLPAAAGSPESSDAHTKEVCGALRRKVSRAEREDFGFVYQNGVFVHPTPSRRNVRLERCHGRALTLPGPSEPTRYITYPAELKMHATRERLLPSEPSNFDLRDGLLTWSTGHNPTSDDPFEEAIEYGRLSAYELSSAKLRTWSLPILPLNGGDFPGIFGYSAHTLNMVFWIAARDMAGDEAGPCCVESSYLYAAPLR